MDRERWVTVKQVFYAALEVPPDERHAYVASASGGDRSIQSEVEQLLRADQDAGSYLEQPLLSGRDNLPSPFPVNPGDVLCGRFQILRSIGEGGMGHVFEALDTELTVNVALKVIRAEIASNPEALARFRQEVRLARRITHPNVCRTFDIERQGRTLEGSLDRPEEIVFLTMEFLEGETLDARIRRDGPVPSEEAFGFAREIADALNAAHRLGIVHRDLKPANIMLVPSGASGSSRRRAVVTDFGLAHFEPAVSTESDPGSEPLFRPSGTLAYMAPEQLENTNVSSATDVYAFGLVLFEMATGQRFLPSAHSPSGVILRRTADRPSPHLDSAGLLPHWRAAIEGCLHAEPAARFQSAPDVIAVLAGRSRSGAKADDGHLQQQSALPLHADAQEESSAINRRGGSRNRRYWIAGGAIAVFLLVLGLALTRAMNHRWLGALLHEDQTIPAFKILPIVSAPGEAGPVELSPDGSSIAYLWDGGDQPHSDLYVTPLNAVAPLRLTHTSSGVIGHPAWSSDGKQIAFSRCDGKNNGIYSVPSGGGQERRLTSAACMQADPGRVAWLPDGKRMLMVDKCSSAGPFGIVIFTLGTGARQCLTNSGPLKDSDAGFDFTLSPDGSTIAFTPAPPAIHCEVYTVPLAGGVTKKLTDGAQCWGELMWTPDGQWILFSSSRTTLFTLCRVSVDGGPIEHSIQYQQVGSMSKDGRHVVYAERSGGDGPDIWRADLASPGGEVRANRKLIKIQSEEKDAQPSPDGSRIVWMSWRTGNAEIWTGRSDGEEQVQLTHLGTYSGTPRWSPDGKSIAFDSLTDRGSQIFVMSAEGQDLHMVTSSFNENVVPSWSRDGQSIYFASDRTRSWEVWKHTLKTGTETQITRQGGFDAFESLDGRSVFFTKFDQAGIWNISKSGGAETLVVAAKPQFGYWGSWAVTREGLYLLDNDADPRPTVDFYNFATHRTTPVFAMSEKPKRLQPGLSATLDGRSVFYTQYTEDDVIQMMQFSQ